MGLTVLVVAPLTSTELTGIASDRRHRVSWPHVTAAVDVDHESGRHEVPVVYRHPVTGQDVDVDVVVVRAGMLPEPGGAMVLAVDPANPDDVGVPGDGDPLRDIVLFPLLIVGVAAAASGARWWAARRTVRLIRSPQTSFAMLAQLRVHEWRPNGVRCSLYPVDARAGARPVCTFDVLTTGGLPIGGAAFGVEVRGRPIPGGLLVARAGDRILRPVRRPLTRGRDGFSGMVADPPPLLLPAPAPSPSMAPVASLWRSLGWFAPACIGAIAVATAITVPLVITGTRASDRLAHTGTAVVAEVVANDDGSLTVRYSGPHGKVEATAVGAESRRVGRRYPAHADETGRVQLDADPYNTNGALIWLTVGWAAAALVTWPRVRWWRDARRAARVGPWSSAVAIVAGRNTRFGPPGDTSGAHTVMCRATPTPSHHPVSVLVAGTLEPGDAVAVVGPMRSCGPAVLL